MLMQLELQIRPIVMINIFVIITGTRTTRTWSYCCMSTVYVSTVTCSLQVELTWEAALLLMEYFHPTSLPSVEDNKYGWSSSLSADVSIANSTAWHVLPVSIVTHIIQEDSGPCSQKTWTR